MTTPRHYARAPITEAIIDLRVNLPPVVDVLKLSLVQAVGDSNYLDGEQLYSGYGQIQFGPQVSASASRSSTGFIFRSVDGKYIYQARLDGFTMSRLAPYESWNVFRDEARRLWDVYCSVAIPLSVGRLAVRYINRIDIPLPLQDFKDYLRTVPEVSPDLPQGLSAYFMQLAIPQNDIEAMALINQTMIEPASPGVVSVVLDVDIFRTTEFTPQEEGIWQFFEMLHDRKNEVFEACITDKARGLFDDAPSFPL
ncbi:MAG: TIGR04255 family protein [Burkholderiales bacterium]|nr:TIGR04255 family protein [Burkholderiales bacterium]